MATEAGADAWTPRQLKAALAAVVGTAVLLVGGLVYLVVTAIGDDDPAPSVVADQPAGSDGTRGQAYRDQLAAEPMATTTRDDFDPAPPALEQLDPVAAPAATTTGPASVPSGFPHTTAGAVAQLAAIATTTIQPMNVNEARAIYNAWGPSDRKFAKWPLAAAIRDFHAAASTTDGDPSISVIAEPVGVQVKGTDGPDWVLACVQLDITATITEQFRFGYGHCEPMRWNNDRWVIDNGAQPATAPSTFPGSQASVDAGWKPWAIAEPEGD